MKKREFLKPPSMAIDRGSLSHRAGQVRAIDGASITIRLQLEAHIVGDRVTAPAKFTGGHAPIVGAPVYVQVTPADDYAIVAVYPSAPADHSLERMWERDGQTFSPGRVMPAHGGNE